MEPGTKIPVWAYSNADEVELFLNGKSLGIDRPGKDAYQMQCEWLVPWTPGTLIAIARTNGKEVARTSHSTAGEPAGLKLQLERLNIGENIITTTLVDDKGTPTPYADNRVHYHLGSTQLASHENGNPVDTENGVTSSSRRAFMGKTRTFLRDSYFAQYSAVTAAAILGSRNGVTATGNRPRISIIADTIIINKVLDHTPKPKLKIHFTTDGSTPTTSSPIYVKTVLCRPPFNDQSSRDQYSEHLRSQRR